MGQDCWWAGRWAEHWATAWAEDGVTEVAGAMEEGGGTEEAGEVCNSISQATSLSCLGTESIEKQDRATRSEPLALTNTSNILKTLCVCPMRTLLPIYLVLFLVCYFYNKAARGGRVEGASRIY